MDGGTPPEQIVDAMVDAVRNDKFWILPNPQSDGAIRERFETMLSRTNPAVRDLRKTSTALG